MRYDVVVPMRTTQSFSVEASSKADAARKVEAWFCGERDEGDDLSITDDVGMTNRRTRPRRWLITEDR